MSEDEPEAPQPVNRLALIFIFITALLDSIGFGIILPVFPQLIVDITGESIAAAASYGGWLMFTFAVMQFLFAPLIGNLSDHYGRRPVLLVSLFVMAINYVLMAVAGSLLLLFIGRLLSGIGASTHSTCNAYIADTVPEDQRAQYFGIMGAAFGMGFILGPVIGGLLGDFGPRTPFYAAAALCVLNMLFGLLVLKESLAPEDRRKFDLGRANPFGTFAALSVNPMIIGIIAVMFMMQLGHFVLPATWSFFTIERFDWTSREVGYSLGFVGVCMVLVQVFVLRLVVPAVGLRMAGVIGMLFNIVAFCGYALATAPWMLYAALVPGALGALAQPAQQGIVTAQAARTQQGELQGGIASVNSLAAIISPPLMAQTFAWFSSSSAPVYFPGAAFVLAALFTAIGLAIFVVITARLAPELRRISR